MRSACGRVPAIVGCASNRTGAPFVGASTDWRDSARPCIRSVEEAALYLGIINCATIERGGVEYVGRKDCRCENVLNEIRVGFRKVEHYLRRTRDIDISSPDYALDECSSVRA